MTDLVESLARAWTLWDARPGAELGARDVEAAARAIAGSDTTRMRAAVTDEMRAGTPIRHAIRAWLNNQETTP